MSEKWDEHRVKHSHTVMSDFKAQIRALQKKRDERLAEIRKQNQYGPQYVDTKSREVHQEAKKKADNLLKDATSLFENVKGQATFYSPEYKSFHDRVIPEAKLQSPVNTSLLMPNEQTLYQTVTEQFKMMREMAEDLRRARLYQELERVPPERFKAILEVAVADSDFATLGIAKQVSSSRKETSIKSAVIDAESRIQLPESEAKIASMIEEVFKMHHAVQSSYQEIRTEGREQDIAAKVERVELEQLAREAAAR